MYIVNLLSKKYSDIRRDDLITNQIEKETRYTKE